MSVIRLASAWGEAGRQERWSWGRCVWGWKRRDGSGRSMRHILVGHGLQYQYQDRAQLSSPEPCSEASSVEHSSVAIPCQSGRKHGYGSLRLVPTSVKTLRPTKRLCRASQCVRVMCCRRTSSAVTSRSAVQRLVDGAAVSHPSLTSRLLQRGRCASFEPGETMACVGVRHCATTPCTERLSSEADVPFMGQWRSSAASNLGR